MSALPLSVRTALWVTASWHGCAGVDDVEHALARAHPDIDHVDGDLSRIPLWRDLGESALLVALPRPGDVSGMPRTTAEVAGAAASVGECVFVAGMGGLLVPELSSFGPGSDEGTQVTWTAHDADPVERHVLEALDLGELERALTTAVADGADALESIEGRPWSSAPRESAERRLRADRWGLPPDLPPRAIRVMTTAARVGVIADEGLRLASAGPSLDLHSSGHRELGLRRLSAAADHALAGAANVAAMTIAGVAPRVSADAADAGRRAHYADFYDGFDDPAGRPVLAVIGNCQAESLRLMLEHDDLRTVRLPAVHEWTGRDLGPLSTLLGRLDLLVAQPVGDDYRGLPVGTGQLLERAGSGLRHVLVPSLRYAGRHPFHTLVHPPHLDDPDPPVAPYHDLRTVVRAAWARVGSAAPIAPPLTAAAVRAVADDSLDELRRREVTHHTIVVSDLLEVGSRPQFRTVNHPGNGVLAPVAARIRSALGLAPRVPRIDRPLLDHIHAPVDPAVVEVFGDEPARATWG